MYMESRLIMVSERFVYNNSSLTIKQGEDVPTLNHPSAFFALFAIRFLRNISASAT